MYRYYDIHTHRASIEQEDCFRIPNVHHDFATAQGPCSMGLHPWHLSHMARDLTALEQYAAADHVLAIGECGLDKITGADWATQYDAFEAQIQLAIRYNKPLIIHCVRAFEPVQQLLLQHKVTVPVIFHGFHKRKEIAAPLLKAGYYLSFGAALLKDAAALKTTLQSVPHTQLFLETDDAPEDITGIYEAAAQIRKTDEAAIIVQLQQNFKTVFGRC